LPNTGVASQVGVGAKDGQYFSPRLHGSVLRTSSIACPSTNNPEPRASRSTSTPPDDGATVDLGGDSLPNTHAASHVDAGAKDGHTNNPEPRASCSTITPPHDGATADLGGDSLPNTDAASHVGARAKDGHTNRSLQKYHYYEVNKGVRLTIKPVTFIHA